MLTHIATSSSARPLGIPPGHACLVVADGQYAGRAAVLYAASPSTIRLVWSDGPHTTVSAPIDVVADAADSPFDAFMSRTGDIYLAYTVAASLDLAFVKLTFSGDAWTVGSKVTVYNAEDCFYPSVCKLSSGQLWIAYTRLSSGSYYVSAKISLDDGATWGSISSPGDTLTSGSTAAFGKMVEVNAYQYLVYTDGGAKIAYRSKPNSGLVWGSEAVLATGAGFNEHLDVAANADGRMGVAYVSSGGLKFREYSGSYWSGEYTIDSGAVVSPAAAYRAGEAWVVYCRSQENGLRPAMFARKSGEGFSSPAPFDPRKANLTCLLVYNAAVGSYQDKTAEAASADTGDVLHSASGALLAAVGDAVYCGLDAPFNYLRLVLSAVGIGGEVAWRYWDGQVWKSLAPESGAWHFSSTDRDQLLWSDFRSIPGDWQKKTIGGHTCYWIMIAATVAFSTAPVGSRVSAVTNLNAFSLQR